jgi:diguanylate cyclase (GGDEF)-like protein/PAS domain S-box-containing protein
MQSYSFDIDAVPTNVAIYEKIDDDFVLTGFNRSAEITENTPRQKLLGKKFTTLFPTVKEFGLFDVLLRVEARGKTEVFDTNFYEGGRISGWRRNEVVKLNDGTVAVFYEDHSLKKELETRGLEIKEKHHKRGSLQSQKDESLIPENYLKIIVNAIPDLIWLKNTEGKYLACNAKFEQFYGAKESEIIGKDDFDFIDFESANIFQHNDRKVLETEQSYIEEEILTFAEDGYIGLFETIKTPMKDRAGNVVGILGIGHDISERKEKEEQLSIYANYDMLTGLANRTLFMNRLSHLMSMRKSSKQYSAVLFIDLDHFKEINDTFGHATGDKILKLVSKALQKVIRKEDTLSRHGGDEFTILLENINKPLDAANIAQHILDTLKNPLVIEDHQFHITTSIGITIAPDDSTDPETLLRFADIAMYKAKDSGRDNYTFYTHDLSKQAIQRVQIEHDLRNAIENNEFTLYYQPQINVLDKKVVGAEALLRWNHPEKGMIMPLQFIFIAESSGQIIDIGKWVIRQAMSDMSQWKKNNLDIDMISINLSVRQLNDKAFIDMIKDSLEATGCSPEWIEFEVTEGYAMSDYKAASSLLREIHDLGCKISIDDFGTGYSSLAHLKRLPIQKIKIDQSFVQDVPGDPNDEAIVSAVILIAKSMNLDIIAEGVETTPQQEFLLNHGCIFSQGFLYTEPIPKDEFEIYLKLISEL